VLHGYPRHAHIPFEDRGAPKRDRRANDRPLMLDAGRHSLYHSRQPMEILNRAYVMPRLARGLSGRKDDERAGRVPQVVTSPFRLGAFRHPISSMCRLSHRTRGPSQRLCHRQSRSQS